MITCYIDYVINTSKVEEFRVYATTWISLVNKFGGQHHGYFLPCEGANNKAYALFSFPSLSEYEKYRNDSLNDDDCIQAYEYANKTKCILSYHRSFLKPLFN
ncbi:NIPSNAP family protein [Aquimarina sp. 2201CG14-23]|uniref:NIPSNAP family protein n=1 Tax=Aquimarina mycalae TaxID=3040073 RepID=UPI002477D29D|nr:NIPSNAP family protein [Aquimarina sp. 2201CG14-23]MDH7446433.1 NIPSNAP family protein [Aquimarina sp. 2201CG14-23]